ncbi:MAG TPA: IPT/TIG domain-containing protein [Thermoanaerobaculia bacterium]|nr:IPT/TIG domain-containing protein [Thermoanaerobaculia bacterium]
MKPQKTVSRLLFALLFAAFVGCQSDSPTEPSGGGPIATPKPPDPVTTFNVSVSANPGEIIANGEASSTITVRVRRTDNGQPPPDGSQVALTTTLGSFGSVNGPNQVTLQLVNGEAQAVLFATTSVGTASVRAVFSGSSGSTNVRINTPATFFVGSVSPSVGKPEGGDEVTIQGGGFDAPVRVTFNGASATVVSVSPTRIRAITPSAQAAGVPVGVGQTGTATVGVTINVNETGQDTDTLDRGFTYSVGEGPAGQPQVFSVSPQSGTNDGGTRVTIVGSGFREPVQVLFGLGASVESFDGVEATVESVTESRIVAITPAARGFGQNLVNQTVDILIKNINSGFSTVRRQQFKYGTDVLITGLRVDTSTTGGRTPLSGGFRGIITGQGFDDPAAVQIHFPEADVRVGQQVVSVTGTQIVFIAGPAPLPEECPENGLIEVDEIDVVNLETGDGDTAELGFIYQVPLPRVFSISPSSGSPGIAATVGGQDFSSATQVIFGDPENGSSAQIVSGSSTSISIRVPNAPQGFEFITEPCDGNGDGVPNGTRLAPTPISVSVRNLDTGCAFTLTNAFVMTPANTTCTGDTSTPPPPPTVQCNDTFDNDGDGLIDAADPQCTGPTDNSEGS